MERVTVGKLLMRQRRFDGSTLELEYDLVLAGRRSRTTRLTEEQVLMMLEAETHSDSGHTKMHFSHLKST